MAPRLLSRPGIEILPLEMNICLIAQIIASIYNDFYLQMSICAHNMIKMEAADVIYYLILHLEITLKILEMSDFKAVLWITRAREQNV